MVRPDGEPEEHVQCLAEHCFRPECLQDARAGLICDACRSTPWQARDQGTEDDVSRNIGERLGQGRELDAEPFRDRDRQRLQQPAVGSASSPRS